MQVANPELVLKDSNNGKTLAKVEEPGQGLIATVLEFVSSDTVKALIEDTNTQQTWTGYMPKETFDALNVSTVSIPANFAGLEAVAVPTRLREQLFRIYAVEENEDYVTVKARHVWYDNLQNYTLWKPTEDTNYTGAAVCRNILTNAVSPVDSNVASDCTDTKPGSEFDFERKNLVECYLDPEKGVCAKYGLSLIRDNWDFYCLKDVGFDRGYVIQTGKNLLGVVRNESIENVVTRTCPIGMDAQGEIVWLDNNGTKYVDSQYINDYSYPRVEIFDTGLQIGQDDVTAENINSKLLEKAQERFSVDKADLPEITMTIDFLSIGDTEEYSQYRGLDKVYLYDIVTIKDSVRGYEYSAQVVGVEHDILTGMLTSVTLGKIGNSDGVRKIAVWQVPEISGENIRLKTILSGSFAEGAINGDDIAVGGVHWVHLDAASITELTTEQLSALTANIHELIAGSITADDILAGSITATAIAAEAITSTLIAADAITSEKISAGAITAEKIGAGAVTTDKLTAYAVTAGKIAANAITSDKISAGAIDASKIDTNDINAINATLGTAQIAIAQIASADINYAHVKDLSADEAIFSTTITEQGIADKLYIGRLAITYGQMVEATIGDLIIGDDDGNYYHIGVEWDDDGVPTLVPTQVTTPSAAEISAGHTSDGKTIIGDVGTFAELSSEDFYAINSIIDRITAKRIDVDELWARQAFIDKLMVTDISSNTYIQSHIGDWQSGSTITQTLAGLESRVSSLGYGTIYYSATEPSHSGLVQGDIWIQPLSDHTWEDYTDSEWQDILDEGSWASVLGAYKVYTWTGQVWKVLFDSTINTEMWTAIEQNAAAIELKANQSAVNILSGEVSEFAATLEVQAQEISTAVSAVNAKTATYIGWTDPTIAHTITLGDIWIRTKDDFGTWLVTKSSDWQNLVDNYVWEDALGDKSYIWDGSGWREYNNAAQEVIQQTYINQTNKQVEILAETTAQIDDEIISIHASLTVANDRISAEVERATSAEGGKIDKTTRLQTADAIVSEAVSQSYSQAQGSFISKTTVLQTADEIVNEAVAQSASAASGIYLAKSGIYITPESIVTESVRVSKENGDAAYIKQTREYHTADAIIQEAVSQSARSASGIYATKTQLTQTSQAIVASAEEYADTKASTAESNAKNYAKDYADDNFYVMRSDIKIFPSGIEISGGKYIKMKSGNTVAMQLDQNGIDMQTAGKFVLHANTSSNSSITFGTNFQSATFAVGEQGDVKAHNINANSISINGSPLQQFVVSETEPSGSNIVWIKPSSTTDKTWNFRPSSLVLDQVGGTLGYYRDFTLSYSASDYLSGNLWYGIKANLQFYNLSGYENDTFKARLKNGSSWIELGSITQTVGQWGTLALDSWSSSATTNIMSVQGGTFTIRLESTASSAKCMLLNEDIIFKAQTQGGGSFAACSVFYKQ